MNRHALQKHLVEAEAQLAEAHLHIAQQRATIVELERDGHNTKMANRVTCELVTLAQPAQRARRSVAPRAKFCGFPLYRGTTNQWETLTVSSPNRQNRL
jgi:hypothetical protein